MNRMQKFYDILDIFSEWPAKKLFGLELISIGFGRVQMKGEIKEEFLTFHYPKVLIAKVASAAASAAGVFAVMTLVSGEYDVVIAETEKEKYSEPIIPEEKFYLVNALVLRNAQHEKHHKFSVAGNITNLEGALKTKSSMVYLALPKELRKENLAKIRERCLVK